MKNTLHRRHLCRDRVSEDFPPAVSCPYVISDRWTDLPERTGLGRERSQSVCDEKVISLNRRRLEKPAPVRHT